MKKLTQFLAVCIALLCFSTEVKATHAAGAELVYEWLNGSTYRFTFKFYRDCSGLADAPTSLNFCYYNNCNQPNSIPVAATRPAFYPGTNIPNGSPVSLGLPRISDRLYGGSIPGYEEWIYIADITFPSQCDHWTIYTGVNARNNAIDNLGWQPGGKVLHVEATLE